jgi:hypothetical protein
MRARTSNHKPWPHCKFLKRLASKNAKPTAAVGCRVGMAMEPRVARGAAVRQGVGSSQPPSGHAQVERAQPSAHLVRVQRTRTGGCDAD